MSLNQLSIEQILLITLLVIGLIYYILIVRYWLRALLSGVRVSQTEILFMRVRNVPVNTILTELIKAHKSGILLNIAELEACHLGGCDLKNVVDGLIYAKSKDIPLTFKEATHLDIQKHDIILYLRNN